MRVVTQNTAASTEREGVAPLLWSQLGAATQGPLPISTQHQQPTPVITALPSYYKQESETTVGSVEENQRAEKQKLQRYKGRRVYTTPGEKSVVSECCFSLLPSINGDQLAPLHVVLPIALPFAKILVAESPGVPSPSSSREATLHHYYLRKEYPSSRNLFSRLGGFCNQSPAWLALDVGYIACRQYQVSAVVDAFLNYFKTCFSLFNARRNKGRASSLAKSNSKDFMPRIRLRCSGLRLRQDQGAGWFLYETPVEVCTPEDDFNFKYLIKLISAFNEQCRSSRICQYATMKPFTEDKFAVVILKQEGSNVSETELSKMSQFQCEGIEVSEIRLVRHKLLDKYGNPLFEKDPRFESSNIFGRPIACNKAKEHARFVFASAPMPRTVTRPSNAIQTVISEFESDSSTEELEND